MCAGRGTAPRLCARLLPHVQTLCQHCTHNTTQANASDAQLMRGSLQLDVSRLLSDGQLTWQDSLHPVAGQQQLADGGEQVR